jgi:acyl-homoserine lactone acylase PvdQ
MNVWTARLAIAMFLALAFSSAVSAADVEIIRDRWGVPHVYAENLADVSFGLAYAQAEDGLEEILRHVVQARGRAAEAFGPRHVDDDLRVHLFRIPEIAERLYRTMSAEARAMVDGHAAGINHYLDTHPSERPAFIDQLTGLDVVIATKWYELLQHASVVRREMSEVTSGAPRATDTDGSNSWAIAPSRSTDGSVMLLADPHLPWDGLTRWHEYQVVVGERWLYGATFVGSPMLGLGFTPDVAWASTNNGADTADVYRETLHPADPDRYLYEGEWRDIETEMITIQVRGQSPVRRPARRTHHGPIVHEDRDRRVAFAVRIAGLETTNFLELGPSYWNATSARDIHRSNRGGDHFKWNRIAADRHGHIGYFYFAATHERSDRFDWRKPVDGTIADTEWGPRIPWDELPATFDPPSGFLMNCNNSPYTVTTDCPIRPSDFPRHLAWLETTLDPTTRAFRATELITARPRLSFRDVERISMDIKAVAAPKWLDAIVEAYAEAGRPDDRDLARAVAILDAWEGFATVDNTALPILSTFVEVVGPTPPERPTAAQVLGALGQALDLMKRRWGSIEVPWGRVHVIRQADLEWPAAGAGNESSAIPFVTLYMTGADRLDEGISVADRGSSWMMLVRYREDGVAARTILPWGNSLRSGSRHAADQAPLYAARTLKDALLTRAEVEANEESRITIHRD